MGMCFFLFHSEGHIGLERKVTKLEAMVKMLQEDLKKVGGENANICTFFFFFLWFKTSFLCCAKRCKYQQG